MQLFFVRYKEFTPSFRWIQNKYHAVGRRQLRRQATRLKTEPIVDNEAEKASYLRDDVDFRNKTEDNEAVEAFGLNRIDLKSL